MSRSPQMTTDISKTQQGNLPEIKTPQELVHIRHRITLLQYKYWILMLRAYRESYEAGEKFGAGDFCYLPMSAVEESIGYQPKTKEIENDLERIRQEPIFYNVLQKDGQKAKRGQGFISEWHVSSNRVGVVLPPVLREAVENLDRKDSIFHLLNWNIFNSFTGKYEAILYKLCKDFVGTGWTKEMSLEDFREYMGVGPGEYPDFKRLNQWAISGPAKKINASEISDIEIEPVFRREQRRVVAIQFKVASKRQTMLDFGDHPAFRFAKVKIARPQQQKYLAEKAPEDIEMSIRRANEFAAEKEKKGDEVKLGAVYATAISEDWGVEYRDKLRAAEEKEKKAVGKRRAAEDSAAGERLRSQFEAEWKAAANAAMEAAPPERSNALFEEWKAEAKPIPTLLKKGPDTELFRVWARTKFVPRPSEAEFAAWAKARTAK